MQEFGEVIVSGADLDGTPIRGEKHYPTYTCVHCSNVVVMNPNRAKARLMCPTHQAYICEKNELCRAGCTPIHDLARDHFEANGRWTKFADAIMRGVTRIDDAYEKGLVKE